MKGARLLVVGVAIAVLFGGGCDQTVIAVGAGPGAGGAGGAGANGGASGNGGAAGQGGGGPCGTPMPVPPYLPSGTSSVGVGLPMECSYGLTDQSGLTWEALCTVDGCSCRFEGVEVCSCAIDPPGSFCDSVDNCCPAGWPSE
jgi:hypothetical protein